MTALVERELPSGLIVVTPPTMVFAFDYLDAESFRFPPPWWVPVEAPACGALCIDTDEDGNERLLVCSRPADHVHLAPFNLEQLGPDEHRCVIDNEIGHGCKWTSR